MPLKKLKKNKFIKVISNPFVFIFLVFLIWILFIDENSYLFHHKTLNPEIEKLEGDKNYYQTEIDADRKKIKQLENPEKLDKFAREKYKMKKENEDIYIIEFDTLQ
ncbi:MAG: septum formation initiator family protein [Flavobacteriaceae bacterium]|nr:septum formation initiator family protein [Flavobacteriaceae bacterium]